MYQRVAVCIVLLLHLVESLSQAPSEWNFNSGSQQVWYGNNLWYENYLGKQSLEGNVDFSYNSQFRICSNSKLFTSVSIMQLVEAGAIASIEDNINEYLNQTDFLAWGLPPGTQRWCPTLLNSTVCQNITLLSLLSMSSGMINSVTCTYNSNEWQYNFCLKNGINVEYPGSIANTIRYFIHHPLQSVPGPAYGPFKNSTNSYFYVNENYVLLSYLVEKLSGMSLRDYYQTHIFDVVGLSSTFYDPFTQSFLMQPRMATEYYFYTNLLQSKQPFAYGTCTATEVSAGFQAGSGGIVSTVPDMVKWYSSLFISKNTSVLRADSIARILYPWSQEPSENSPVTQYYGLGVDLIFDHPPSSPPAWPAPAPSGIYYMGGSVCTFFSIVAWFGRTSVFTGQPLVTVPVVSVAARNNRILNVTQQAWTQAQNQRVGTFFSLTDFPTGWGGDDADLTDTLMIALNTLYYFAAQPFSGPIRPTTAPSVAPAVCADTSNSGLSTGQVVAAVLVPCLVVMIGIVAYFLLLWTPRATQQSVKSPELKEFLIHSRS